MTCTFNSSQIVKTKSYIVQVQGPILFIVCIFVLQFIRCLLFLIPSTERVLIFSLSCEKGLKPRYAGFNQEKDDYGCKDKTTITCKTAPVI